ncbi:amino acid permease [Serratia symbiotica]|uniref:amino acid permease n=1 Tax=Serratia symbiotica TaxID=138074 RepID=UPI002091D697|nr:amino acid permease [Serratia symbiotica]
MGGYFFQSVFLVAILVNTFAAALASHASAARLLNIMGRDRIFPKRFFGYKSPETQSPLYCILFVVGISMTAVFFNLDTAVSLISFGALVAFSSVNISVLIQFSIVKKQVNSPREIIDNMIIPVMGLLSVGVMWFNLDKDAMVFGLAWAAPSLAYLIYCKLTNKVVILSDN